MRKARGLRLSAVAKARLRRRVAPSAESPERCRAVFACATDCWRRQSLALSTDVGQASTKRAARAPTTDAALPPKRAAQAPTTDAAAPPKRAAASGSCWPARAQGAQLERAVASAPGQECPRHPILNRSRQWGVQSTALAAVRSHVRSACRSCQKPKAISWPGAQIKRGSPKRRQRPVNGRSLGGPFRSEHKLSFSSRRATRQRAAA